MNNQPLVQLRDLSRNFAVRRGFFAQPVTLHAVQGVSLDIFRGESLGLVGESGCGKSTLARMLVGLLAPDSGNIFFDGKPMWVNARPALPHGRLQMVFQDPFSSLNPRMRVGKSVAEPLLVQGVKRAECRQLVEEMFAMVGLAQEQARLFPHEFSGGQRQRIALARALITRPDMLVCDEPVSALDASVQGQVLNLLRDMQDRFGLSLLFISHSLPVVAFMCRRIAVMYLGKIVELTDKERLFCKAAHPYSQALVEAMPTQEPEQSLPPVVTGEPPNPLTPPSGCVFHPRCPVARELCREAVPVLRDVDGRGWLARCHFAQV